MDLKEWAAKYPDLWRSLTSGPGVFGDIKTVAQCVLDLEERVSELERKATP